MDQLKLYRNTSYDCSKLITNKYSTSFSLGIKCFNKRFRWAIYAIYGFVRVADEIVDTLHGYNKAVLLEDFRQQTYDAVERGISTNPVLQAFQEVVRQYGIEQELYDAFLNSMAMDLEKDSYAEQEYHNYIFGSAEAVGLMSMRVFTEGNRELYEKLKPHAQSLGAAFQKVNFLRDLKSDYQERGRVYFPGIDFSNFDASQKAIIEKEIEADFKHAYQGILGLPKGARLGVYVAYKYYYNLFAKIAGASPLKVKSERIRVPDGKKFYLLFSSAVRNRLNLL